MFRRFVLWMFIVLLPLQCVQAAQHVRTAADHPSEGVVHGAAHGAQQHGEDRGAPARAVRHWLANEHGHGGAHHHHEDGGVHFDDSPASQEHAGDPHFGCHLSGLPQAAVALRLPLFAGTPPEALVCTGRPDPFLDKPPRPPHRLG